MNERIKQLWDKAATASAAYPSGQNNSWETQVNFMEKFAELIVRECAACCGSQADKKNIRRHFGLPVESDVKYPGPDAHWSVTSQYTRDYNIPNDK